jgi:hypothetical protein
MSPAGDVRMKIIEARSKAMAEGMAANDPPHLYCVMQPVESAEHRGWDFRFRCRKRRLWCQVSLIEGYLVMIRDLSARWRIFAGDHPDFVRLMSGFGEALATDGRFHDIGWFHEHEILERRAGAARPDGVFRDTPCVRRQPVEETAGGA